MIEFNNFRSFITKTYNNLINTDNKLQIWCR
jgi:hypothetical protein